MSGMLVDFRLPTRQDMRQLNNTMSTLNTRHDMQQQAMQQQRQSKKRTFADMSAGSATLAAQLGTSRMMRLPARTLVYRRVLQSDLGGDGVPDHAAQGNVFQLMKQRQSKIHGPSNFVSHPRLQDSVSGDVDMCSHEKDEKDEKDTDEKEKEKQLDQDRNQLKMVLNPTNRRVEMVLQTDHDHDEEMRCPSQLEEPLQEEWLDVFDSAEGAEKGWSVMNPNGRLWEYQLCQTVVIIDVSGLPRQQVLSKQSEIRNYVLDHGHGGYVFDSKCFLYRPERFWRLLDDDKRVGRNQMLISDMFKRAALRG